MAAIRATYKNTILDTEGEPVDSAYIELRTPNTTTPIADIIYADATGAGALSNPFQTDAYGRFNFYLASPKRVDIHVSSEGHTSYTLEDVDVTRAGDKADGAEASVADGATISHGLAATPRLVLVQASVAGEFISVTAIGATTFTVAIKAHGGGAGTTQTVYWRAYL